MTDDKEARHIARAVRIAKMAHNEAIRQAKFEIELTLMTARVPAGILTDLLKAMDGLILHSISDDGLHSSTTSRMSHVAKPADNC